MVLGCVHAFKASGESRQVCTLFCHRAAVTGIKRAPRDICPRMHPGLQKGTVLLQRACHGRPCCSCMQQCMGGPCALWVPPMPSWVTSGPLPVLPGPSCFLLPPRSCWTNVCSGPAPWSDGIARVPDAGCSSIGSGGHTLGACCRCCQEQHMFCACVWADCFGPQSSSHSVTAAVCQQGRYDVCLGFSLSPCMYGVLSLLSIAWVRGRGMACVYDAAWHKTFFPQQQPVCGLPLLAATCRFRQQCQAAPLCRSLLGSGRVGALVLSRAHACGGGLMDRA